MLVNQIMPHKEIHIILPLLLISIIAFSIPVSAEGKRPSSFTLTQQKHLLYGGYADASVIQADNGVYLMYVSRSKKISSHPGVFVLSSQDGLRWREETDTVLSGVAVGRAVRFSDGIRFYYHQPPGRKEDLGSIVSSFSKDGLTNWKYEAVRIKGLPGYAVIGPTIIQLPDSTYRMFFHEAKLNKQGKVPRVPRARIMGASSKDGLNWYRDKEPSIIPDAGTEGGRVLNARHPFAMPYKDGYLMFYWAGNLIFAAYSDDTYKWQKLGSTGIHGADPHLIPLKDGRYRIYYGGRCEHTPRCFSYDGPGVINTGILEIK